MKRLACLIAASALAGCGDPPRDGPAGSAGTAGSAPATPAATPAATPGNGRQIGTTSGLSGATSALTGTVSAFQVRQTATATVATLATDTLFAFNSATVAPEAADNLRRTADVVRQGGKGAVQVIGHTDGKGDDAYNDALSKRRAQAVADWLGGPGGLSDRRFEVDGRGKREPVTANTKSDGSDDPDGRARNRRVEVVVPRA